MVRVHLDPRRLAGLALLLVACGGPDRTTGGNALAVSSTVPAGGAGAVTVNSLISATLSQPVDPASISAASLTVSGGVSGTVAASGSTITFTPTAPLAAASSYTATLAGSVGDMSGATLGNDYQWSFATAVPPIPVINIPFLVGRKWGYARNDTTTIVAASTGVTQVRFTGERYAWVAEQLSLGGRSAWRVNLYDYNSTPSSGDPEFTVEQIYLAQDANGLARWVALSGGGEWRQVLSTQSADIANGTFVFSQGPTHGGGLHLSTGNVTVPAGSYPSVIVGHHASQHDQYATATWDEDRVEAFADGVGVVRSRWDYFYDDKDPQAADISQHGSVVLFQAFGRWGFNFEDEPNDTTGTATRINPVALIVKEGVTQITDRGSLMSDAALQCPVAVCVHPNKNGQPLLQDWYWVAITATTNVKIELAYDPYNAATNSWNDLDLYAFQAVAAGGLKYVAASVAPQGKAEALVGTLGPGTYYFAVQAWDTNGPVRYWLSFR